MSDGIENPFTEDMKISYLKKVIEVLFPDTQVAVIWDGNSTDPSNVGILASVTTDAEAVRLMTAAVIKISQNRTDTSDVAVTVIPLANPHLN